MKFEIHVLPRTAVSIEQFYKIAQPGSIALDGFVKGAPFIDEDHGYINADHHNGVIREFTMSTAMQIFFAVKGGLMKCMKRFGDTAHIWINDTDQDTCLAVYILKNYKQFEGVASSPAFNRLLDITNKLDVTAGAFPLNLNDAIMRQHEWIFSPYTELRRSGALANGNEAVLRDNLEAVLGRISDFLAGKAQEIPLNTEYEIIHKTPDYYFVNEIGGNAARYQLFSEGMDAYISIIALRPDGRRVITIGRRSRFILFPLPRIFQRLNNKEGLTPANGWDGSDIVGGSSRANGTSLSNPEIIEEVDQVLLQYRTEYRK